MNRGPRIVAFVLAARIAATGSIAFAGDLNPPAGPVGPTMKMLSEVEPRIAISATSTPGDTDSLFKITQPGSYYLTGNITGLAGKHGVEIAASGVTLDLHGFDLQGVAGSLDGVSVTELSLKNIAVVNGSVRSWGGDGVDLRSFGAGNCRAAELLAAGNTGDGIKVGSVSTVLSCSAYQNTGNGITTGNACTVADCLAYQNTASGIRTNTGCTLSNCSAYVNAGNGITVDNGSTVLHCSAVFNTGNGISTFEGGCTVSRCSAYSNFGNGISVNSNCTVAECTAQGNTLDGIRCSPGCLIRNNACSFNGTGGDGAGIHATGADSRIEDNNCTSADRGIDVDQAGNIIVRNTCSGNLTNWDVVAGNVCLVVQGATGAAILGDTGGAAPGSIDPNANFTY